MSDGISTTTINFDLGANSDRATNDVRNAIAQIRQSLPQDINDPTIVQRLEFTGSTMMTYVLTEIFVNFAGSCFGINLLLF